MNICLLYLVINQCCLLLASFFSAILIFPCFGYQLRDVLYKKNSQSTVGKHHNANFMDYGANLRLSSKFHSGRWSRI